MLAQHKLTMMHIGLAGLFGMLLGYRLPLGIVQSRAKKRQKTIQLALPFTFDLISVSVSAGMAFDGAMQVVAERTTGALADELHRTLREINLGISREEALNNLVKRTGVEDLRTFVAAVNYISKLGGSLVSVIQVQTDALRVKRRQRAEKKANQAPVKIMFPLVLFIFPCLFIVILGPAVVTLLTKTLPF
jgi:tight adherence protein C